MSFIGHDQVPAPKLKEVKLSSEEMKDAYYQTLHVSCAFIAPMHWLVNAFLPPKLECICSPSYLGDWGTWTQLFKANLGSIAQESILVMVIIFKNYGIIFLRHRKDK